TVIDEGIQYALVRRVRESDGHGLYPLAIIAPVDILTKLVEDAGKLVQLVPAVVSIPDADELEARTLERERDCAVVEVVPAQGGIVRVEGGRVDGGPGVRTIGARAEVTEGGLEYR